MFNLLLGYWISKCVKKLKLKITSKW